jgi:hypothetical protein
MRSDMITSHFWSEKHLQKNIGNIAYAQHHSMIQQLMILFLSY